MFNLFLLRPKQLSTLFWIVLIIRSCFRANLVAGHVRCVEHAHAKTCFVRRACLTSSTTGFFCSGEYKEDISTSVAGPLIMEHVITLSANATCALSMPDTNAVHCIMKPFYLPNTGHALGDDMYSVYRALRIFGLHEAPSLHIVSAQDLSTYPERVLEMYRTVNMTLSDLQPICYDNLVFGIAGLSFHESSRNNDGVLASFRDFVFKRSGVLTRRGLHRRVPSAQLFPSFTVIAKDFDRAEHPQGIGNPDAVLETIKRAFPLSFAQVITLSKTGFRDQLEILSRTDILISAPGSDLMSALFLLDHRVVLVVPLCKRCDSDVCETSDGNEIRLWFQYTGTLHIISYGPIFKPEVLVAGVDRATNASYFKVSINESRLLMHLNKANATLHAIANVLPNDTTGTRKPQPPRALLLEHIRPLDVDSPKAIVKTSAVPDDVTVVSGYWHLQGAKHTPDEYAAWYQHTLSIQAPYVFYYCDEGVPGMVGVHRRGIATAFIHRSVTEFHTYHTYNFSWVHPQYLPIPYVGMVFLEKLHMVLDASRRDIFSTNWFAWIDAGIVTYRNKAPPDAIWPDARRLASLPTDAVIYSSNLGDPDVYDFSGTAYLVHRTLLPRIAALYDVQRATCARLINDWRCGSDQYIWTRLMQRVPGLFHHIDGGNAAVVSALYATSQAPSDSTWSSVAHAQPHVVCPPCSATGLHDDRRCAERSIVSGRLVGGLGNQLFVMARTYIVASHACRTPAVHAASASGDVHTARAAFIDSVFARYFQIKSAPDAVVSETAEFVAAPVHKETPLPEVNHVQLSGYWQHETNIDPKFVDTLVLPRIKSRPHTAFVHVRRGDYLDNSLHNVGLYDSGYYSAAMEVVRTAYMQTHHQQGSDNPPLRFLVFSDDMAWCRNSSLFTGRSDVGFFGDNGVDDDDAAVVLANMAACEVGGVAANSSFSWWAAFLISNPGKVMVFPRAWLNNGLIRPIDVWPAGAHVVDFDGTVELVLRRQPDQCPTNFEGTAG